MVLPLISSFVSTTNSLVLKVALRWMVSNLATILPVRSNAMVKNNLGEVTTKND
jgi:hypothetical protein